MALRILLAIPIAGAVGLIAASAAAAPALTPAVRNLPSPADSAAALLRDNALGVLRRQAAVREADVRRRCLAIPPRPDDEVYQDEAWTVEPPADCRVVEVRRLGPGPGRWTVARYRRSRGARRPAAAEGESTALEEVVLFEGAGPSSLRPVWRDRFFSDGDRGIWRSVTPQVATAGSGAVLVGVRYCVNGTGGCSQQFLRRGPDHAWTAIRQPWLDQLPRGYKDRIRHGVEIDPASLNGLAGFYGDGDPNCCPSQQLSVKLALRGDALMLLSHRLSPTPAAGS